MRRIYLDYAATSPTRPEVLEAMLPYFYDYSGNPSSKHSYGQESVLDLFPQIVAKLRREK